MSNRAWVTLATNDSYGLGALVLAHSLRRAGSAYPSVVLITPSVTDAMRERLRAVFAEVVIVDVLDSRDAAHLALLQRPELGITFTKIHCWNLTQYEKCVFLDADILVVQNCDELFEREELSAAPDVGWPDCFNSGVFVFTPSTETFNQLIAFARERGSFDGGDQGLLNSFFSDWAHGDINKHLPFLYNVTSAAFYSYLPALKHYGQNLKIIHFIGAAKPWLQHFNWESSSVDAPEHLREFLQLWWDLFVAQVHPRLDISMVEVEEETPVPPPEQPPHDVNPHYHYQPVLDPESEFHWHHPDAQIQEEMPIERIDFTDIHDPWEIYRGHIPPRSNQESTSHTIFERNEDQDEIRQYAWNYHPQHNDDKTNQETQGLYEKSSFSGYCSDDYQLHSYDKSYDHFDESQIFKEHNNESLYYQQYPEIQNQHQHNETQSCSYHHEEHRHSQQNHPAQEHCQYEYQHQSNQNYCQYEQSIDNNAWHRHSYEPPCGKLDSYKHSLRKHSDYDNFYSNEPNQNHNNSEHDNTYKSCNDKHEQYNKPNWHQKHYQDEIQYSHKSNNEHHHDNSNDFHECIDHNKQYHSQNYDHTPQQIPITSNAISDKTSINECFYTFHDNQIDPRSKSKDVEEVQVQRRKKRIRQSRMDRIDLGMSTSKMNGDLSDIDSDDSEEIVPRHPYDGFYLRHRAVIDPYGRKICTHEIPPAPPQSPTPPPQHIFEMVSSEGDQDLPSSESDNQSGVAGNLARVVPGASGSQREALDDLTRRQGWEAGNIDYMGADSFANIWAKISQTLSQPRTSPAKSPPRETVSPQPTSAEALSDDTVPEKEAEPVELAKEAIESTPIEAPAAVETIEVPKVTDSVESLKAPVSADATVEAAMAEQEVAPVEVAAPVETSEPMKTSATVDDTSAPIEPAASIELAAPVQSAAPVEIPATVDTAQAVLETNAPAIAEPVAPAGAPVEAVQEPEAESVIDVPITVDAPAPSAEETAIDVATSTEVPITVDAAAKLLATPVTESIIPIPVENRQKTDSVAAVKSMSVATEPQQPAVAPSDVPLPVDSATDVPVTVDATPETKKTETVSSAVVQPEVITMPEAVAEAPKFVAPIETSATSPAVAAEAPRVVAGTTPPKTASAPAPASDSPPLAHTPSKEEVPAVPAAKSEERRKPAGKLQLSPPAALDPLPTPDSEAEDAAALAHSIIASELQAAAKAEPVATPPPTPVDRLTVQEPEVPTPPVGAVSLAQIGVKSPKGKPTIAAQIESSIAEKDDSIAVTSSPAEVSTKEPPKEAPKEAPKKKVVKKVVKKDTGASGAGGEAPVPPPRKKEKKPKEK